MMQRNWIRGFAAVALTGSLALPALAAGLMDTLKSQATEQLSGQSSSAAAESSSSSSLLGGLGSSGLGSSLGLPAIGGNTTSNVAGVIEYCVKNNYLNANGVQGVKDKLLGKIGLGQETAQKDDGYQKGIGGILQGGDGSSFSLDSIKGKLKEKACDYVLDNAKSLI